MLQPNNPDHIDHECNLEEGTVLDERYLVGELLGVGGFSEVYAGVQVNIGRPVALKVLGFGQGVDHPDSRERFMREARVAARLSHPGIVEIYDFGETPNGDFYIVLELMEGEALDSYMAHNGPLELDRVCYLVIQVLHALAVAHNVGVVHRDLKPANIFVDSPHPGCELLRILDFGIAYMIEDPGSRLTITGEMIGTPQYMSPEYLVSQEVSTQMDIYQMGLVLVEMLTGKPLMPNPNMLECYKAHTQGELNIPADILSGPLSPVIRGSLAIDPEERFRNATAMRMCLEGCLDQILPYSLRAP